MTWILVFNSWGCHWTCVLFLTASNGEWFNFQSGRWRYRCVCSSFSNALLVFNVSYCVHRWVWKMPSRLQSRHYRKSGVTQQQLLSKSKTKIRWSRDGKTTCRKCPTLAKRLLHIVHVFCPPSTSPFSPVLHPFALSLLLFTSRINWRYQCFHPSIIPSRFLALPLSRSPARSTRCLIVSLARSLVVSLSCSCWFFKTDKVCSTSLFHSSVR